MKYTINYLQFYLLFQYYVFNSRNFYISYLFENKFLVFLGFISYALYLWHWPILSLFKYYAISEIKLQDNLVLILCSIVLAFLTTKYFENKFRYSINKNYTLASIIFIFFLVITINPQISLFKKRTFDEKNFKYI